jgi:hypothetical protein
LRILFLRDLKLLAKHNRGFWRANADLGALVRNSQHLDLDFVPNQDAFPGAAPQD